MEFEPAYIEEKLDKDYFGYGDAYIDVQGYRRKGERPKAVLEGEGFSKSILDDEDGGYYYDEYGRRKKKVTELQDINVEEISYVDRPATKKMFSVIKGLEGDDKKVDRCEWATVQKQIFGYTEDDLEECDYEEEIEKSSDSNPFPSLARIFNNNKRVLEGVYEEYAIGEGVRFL